MTLMPDSSNNTSALNTDIPSAGRLLSDPPGAVLKRARQARKLDLETAADQLNLSAQVVRALEEDAYEKLPSPTFIRGYIRCYARLLKLSGDDLVRSYERVATAQQPESQDIAEVKEAKPQKIKKGWIVLGLLVFVVAVIGFVVTSDEPTVKELSVKESTLNETESSKVLSATVEMEPKAELKMETPVEEPVTGTPVVAPEDASKVAIPEVTPEVVTAVVEIPVVEIPVAEPVSATPITPSVVSPVEPADPIGIRETEPTAISESTAEVGANALVNTPENTPLEVLDEVLPLSGAEEVQVSVELSTLTMTFIGECWVEVWDATGKRIYANLRNAGQRVSLQGVAPIEVKLGDGSMAKLEFNGSPVLFASSKRTSVAHVTLGE